MLLEDMQSDIVFAIDVYRKLLTLEEKSVRVTASEAAVRGEERPGKEDEVFLADPFTSPLAEDYDDAERASGGSSGSEEQGARRQEW